MAATIYFLCALTSLACFLFLFRGWRASRARLLFWSAMCFGAMTVNNFLLVADKLLFPTADLSSWRLVMALTAVTLLLFGLIWDEE
ncbi:DUF5985 family protein [Ramlibacter rhizophilus]|uniref:Uncharacterized protein n=1 Tax=Ramlibacter rhizophilus TaxID=1781167 RepID=A0A4Z0BDW9_9BURK|nr:DUF5985 family protein [Ramlibacter rhizophilus]TFY97525.1 hypothetical protein EZ242_18585 [Ramlibacter rhizophilus]